MEEILKTSDHMIVDPLPVTSQEKGKSQADDPPQTIWYQYYRRITTK
jgi:hypothetical protein